MSSLVVMVSGPLLSGPSLGSMGGGSGRRGENTWLGGGAWGYRAAGGGTVGRGGGGKCWGGMGRGKGGPVVGFGAVSGSG